MAKSPTGKVPAGMVAIKGGRFTMGSEKFYPEERPRKTVDVASFYIQQHEVTNAQFEAFVKSTGYVTVAERPLDAKQFPQLSEAQRVSGVILRSGRRRWDHRYNRCHDGACRAEGQRRDETPRDHSLDTSVAQKKAFVAQAPTITAPPCAHSSSTTLVSAMR